ncbi:hypothetical protein [Dysgonomonas macrotermitis]|uniref:MG2 domain-containing protein n=1 Tax=Dysgonomonas macrotermitis TaxID=1346286 RepID=A0A1M4WL68_9BACT|nr:hypothetical protein [Dysgonomonas macrotermitis]SHE82051.1 hypothetical protein SAMN05444362_102255 [Dysgonomonas macrotermitis]
MKTPITLILSILFSSLLYGQTPQDSTTQKLYSFVKNINTFSYLYPQEKVYLHFDNTGYFLGETIWFKAYVVTASDLQPSDLSKVLYAEILTPEGQIMESKKLKLENGQAHADFMLKDSLYAGYYEVRAYTKSMLNFGEDVVFSRVFPVFDKPQKEGDYSLQIMKLRPRTKKVEDLREASPKYKSLNMAFYPEGGNLVQGLSNKVAFKITGDKGDPVETTGIIQNSQGQEITNFTTLHEGMGSFILYPDGNKYTAVVKETGKDKEYKFELPETQTEGYALQINNLDTENLTVQIQKASGTVPELLGISFVCRGKAYVFDILELQETDPLILNIPKKSLPTGVAQITLFNSEGRIWGERLAFVNHGIPELSIERTIQSDFQPFSPVRVDFVIKDNQGQPVESNFSLSIRDTQSLIPTSYTGNLQTDLLLSSELKGYINNPAYYFEQDDARHSLSLDLLLLTQGWRSSRWKQMVGIEKFDVKHGIENGLILGGQVLSAVQKKKKENIEVSLKIYYPDGKTQGGDCPTDENGKFNFALQDYYGKADLKLTTRVKGKPEHTRILLDRLFSPTPIYYEYYQTAIPTKSGNTEGNNIKITEIEESVDSISVDMVTDMTVKTHQLSEVTVTEKKKWSQEQEGLNRANVVYNVNEEIENIRDAGDSEWDNILDFLEKKNTWFTYVDYYTTYKGRLVIFVVDNMLAKISPLGIESAEPFNNFNKDKSINMNVKRSLSDISIDQVDKIMFVEDGSMALRYSPECGRIRVDPLTGLFTEDTEMMRAPRECYVVYIYTKKGGNPIKEPKGTRSTSFQGYGNVRQFSSPNYSSVQLPDEKDFRRTLYWNPNIRTDKEGKVSVNFYNNSNCKEFDINIESL